MKLQNLHLRNFRCFEDLDISFHDQLTVIVGENGAGKTAILEASAVAIGTFLYSMKGINYGLKRTDAHNKYFNIGSSIDIQPQYPVEVQASGIVDGKHIRWERTLNSENGKTTVIGAKDMTLISEQYRNRMMKGDLSLRMPIVAYYGTGRLWDYHREKKIDTFRKSNRSNGYIDCLDGTANVKLMLNWFKNMAYADGQIQKPSAEFAAVRGAMEKCFALMTGIDDVHVQFNPFTAEIEISYIDGKESARIPLNQMSDGYKGTISLIADIAYRMAILNPGFSDNVINETQGVILIDEVDLHLHPAWQQRIINDLTSIFPKVQFIVSTHASAVINSVKSENLLILKNQQVYQSDNQVYGKDVKSVLNEIMGVSERPPEIKKLFSEFYDKLNDKDFDEAEKILNQLDIIREYHDPELAGARVKLKLERIRGERHD